jgi:fumarate reductase flavoprotein subunit
MRIFIQVAFILFVTTSCFNVVLASDISASFFTSETTADVHKAKGMKCITCHPNGKPSDVDSEICVKCHGGYEKIKSLPGVSAMEYNPHHGHFVDLECTTCHKGHEVGENFCDSCHKK